MKNLVLNPLGLITRPNKYGQYPPGAMSTCKNVCLRDRGILSSMPGLDFYSSAIYALAQNVTGLFPLDTDRFLISGTTTWRFGDGNSFSAITDPPGFPATTDPSFDATAGTTHVARPRGRTLITSDQGVIVFDDAVSFTAPRASGAPFPRLAMSAVTGTNAQSLADSRTRSYRAVVRRTMADGYVLTSEVSPPFKVTNTSGATVDVTTRVYIYPVPAKYAVAGDAVEVYRTKDVASGSDPGDRMFLCIRYTLTSTDITNGYADIRDTSVDANLSSEELYTNPAQQGLDQTNSPPPLAHDVCNFKSHTFYLSRKVPAQFVLTINGAFGVLTSTAQRLYGIGSRTLTGDTTNGSNQILNGSNMNGIAVGQEISGAGIPAQTRITAVAGTTITISANATATAAGVSLLTTDLLEYGAGATDYWYMLPDTAVGPLATASLIDAYTNTPLTAEVTAGPVIAVTTPDIGRTFVIRARRFCDGTFTLRGSNGQNYTPQIPGVASTAVSASQDERGNRFHWSKLDQPEAVPPLNYQFVGSGTVHRLIATKDAVYAFASDGLHRVTGSAPPWTIDPVDRTLVLVDRLAVDVMDDVIYALTNRGLVAIVGDSIAELSREVIDLGVDGVEAEDGHAGTWMVACDSKHREVWLTNTVSVESTTYIYNVMTRSFVQFDPDDLIGRLAYSVGLGVMAFTDEQGSSPHLNFFRADSSTTRLAGADVRLQPLTAEGDPFSQKEWQDVEYLFAGFSSAGTLVPTFDGTAFNARTVPASSIESRCVVSVPRNAPRLGSRIAPGFTLSAGGTAQIWSLRGIRARFELVAEQGLRR